MCYPIFNISPLIALTITAILFKTKDKCSDIFLVYYYKLQQLSLRVSKVTTASTLRVSGPTYPAP